jgi:homoserine kinase type II
MGTFSLNEAARHVVADYPRALQPLSLLPLGNHGGFSGARLWRGEGPAGACCVRAWPPGEPGKDRLDAIHRLMIAARQAGLEFVPEVLASTAGPTWVEHAGRLWDLTGWLRGRADFHQRPAPHRLEAACIALARLHLVWAAGQTCTGVAPAIQRRLAVVREWLDLLGAGWRPDFERGSPDPVRPWAERAWRVLPSRLEPVPRALAPWAQLCWTLQPCLCDIWHDHVLFEGDRVTGLIDYGSVKQDHVAVDLARLLGSLVGCDRQQREIGLEAYRRLRPLTAQEQALVDVLDESGTLLAAANWLKWLYHERRSFPDANAVAGRLAVLVERIDG